jgi:hypothetical protein
MEQEHILNENELAEAYEQLRAVDDKITDLKKRKAEINHLITASAIAKVKAKYPGIEYGDKVEVAYDIYDWRNSKTTKAMVGFMGNFFMNKYYSESDRDRESYVRLKLYEVKKDGTMSLRNHEFSACYIVSIKKVEE